MLTLVTKQRNHVDVRKGVREEDVAQALHGPLVLDISQPTKEEGEILTRLFHFHPLAIEDAWEEVNHPKVDDYGNVLFLVFHEPQYGEKRFTTREIEFFLSRSYLVVFHKTPFPSIEGLYDKIEKRPELFDRGMDYLLYIAFDQLIDGYFPVLEKLEGRIDELEDSIVRNPTKNTVNGIFSLKRELLHLKKVIGPQREMLNRFTRGEFPHVSKGNLPYFRDLYDHIYRIYDMSESFRDLLSGALDAYLSSLSNRMNEIMKVLTIITTILLPLSLIAGIYGMNFQYMPELHRQWGYPAAIVLMFVVAFGMVRFFKRRGWM